ncbi:fatty acid synthase alpha subunit Lsd1, partial [Coemansia sp. S17]
MLAGSLSILQAANDDSLEPVIKLVSKLHNDCTRSLKQPPVYRELSTPTGPQIDIGSDGTLTGGLNIIKHIGRVISKAKMDIEQKSALLQLIARENALDYESMSRPSSFTNSLDFAASPLARHKYDFPAPRQFDQLQHLRHLQGMVNLDKVVVITGYGEIGPY